MNRCARVVVGVVWCVQLGGLVAAARAAEPLPVSTRVIGEETTYRVKAGDTLGSVARRFGVSRDVLAALNGIGGGRGVRIGQLLHVSTPRIVPAAITDGLVVNLGDLTLYWLDEGALVKTFPVAVGRQKWETPAGRYAIIGRRRDPVWRVPPSIQQEMRRRGAAVKTKVPPGPDNPLGKYWLQLSINALGIHGTNAPWSVGKYTTHGCVRMRAGDIERLYKDVPDGTAVDVVDAPVKVADVNGRILLEAHRGMEGCVPRSVEHYVERLRASDVGARVDVAAAERVIRAALGVAVDVTGSAPNSVTARAD